MSSKSKKELISYYILESSRIITTVSEILVFLKEENLNYPLRIMTYYINTLTNIIAHLSEARETFSNLDPENICHETFERARRVVVDQDHRFQRLEIRIWLHFQNKY